MSNMLQGGLAAFLGDAGGVTPPDPTEFEVVRDWQGHYRDFTNKWLECIDMVWDVATYPAERGLAGPLGVSNGIKFISGADGLKSHMDFSLLGWNSERYVEFGCWINIDDITPEFEYELFLIYNVDNGYNIGVNLIANVAGGVLVQAHHEAPVASIYTFTHSTTIATGSGWVFIVVQWDHGNSANPTMRITIDGSVETGYPSSQQIAASTYDQYFIAPGAGVGVGETKGFQIANTYVSRLFTSDANLTTLKNSADQDAWNANLISHVPAMRQYWQDLDPPIPPDGALGDRFVHDVSGLFARALAPDGTLNRAPAGAGPIGLSNYYTYRAGCIAEATPPFDFTNWGHTVNFWFKWNSGDSSVKNTWVIKIDSDTGGGYMQLELHDTGASQFIKQTLKPDNGDPLFSSQTGNLTTLFDGNWHKITWFTGSVAAQWRIYYDGIDWSPTMGAVPAQSGAIVNYCFGNMDCDLSTMMYVDVYDSSLPPNLGTFTNETTVLTYGRDNNYNAFWRMQNTVTGILPP